MFWPRAMQGYSFLTAFQRRPLTAFREREVTVS